MNAADGMRLYLVRLRSLRLRLVPAPSWLGSAVAVVSPGPTTVCIVALIPSWSRIRSGSVALPELTCRFREHCSPNAELVPDRLKTWIRPPKTPGQRPVRNPTSGISLLNSTFQIPLSRTQISEPVFPIRILGRGNMPTGFRFEIPVSENRFLESGFLGADFPSRESRLEILDSRNRIPKPLCITPGQGLAERPYFSGSGRWSPGGLNVVALRRRGHHLEFSERLFPRSPVGR
jgi:hypothetical protein